MKDLEREVEPRQREKQAPWRKPNVGLHPGTLGSCPEPKADTQPLSHPGIPILAHNFQKCQSHERQRKSEKLFQIKGIL